MSHPDYKPIIGTEFSSIHIENWILILNFSVESDNDTVLSYDLETTDRVCLDKSKVFQPFSGSDVIEPDDLPRLYSALGEKVIDFKPLSINGACRLDLENCSLFVWLKNNEREPLIHAKAFGVVDDDYKQVKYWAINDV